MDNFTCFKMGRRNDIGQVNLKYDIVCRHHTKVSKSLSLEVCPIEMELLEESTKRQTSISIELLPFLQEVSLFILKQKNMSLPFCESIHFKEFTNKLFSEPVILLHRVRGAEVFGCVLVLP